jgi:hypothetical protein
MIHAIRRPSMKATSSKAIQVASLSLSILVVGMCGVACDQSVKVHRDARAAMSSIGNTNLVELWPRVAPFAAVVSAEDRLPRLAVNGNDVFAILAGQVIDAKRADGKLVSADPARPLSDADAEYILGWIARCKTYGACGYDVRSLPAYYRVFIRNDVCFIILRDEADPQCRNQFASQAKQGVTPRGDAFRHLTNNVYLATERR